MYSTLRSKIGKNGVALLSFTSHKSSIPLTTWLNVLDGSCTLDTAADSWDTIRESWKSTISRFDQYRGQQSWTLNENNRATIVDVSDSRSYSRIVYFVLLISFFHILLINSKFSILQHIPTCLLKPFLKHPKGFRTKGFLLVPIALTDMVVIRRPKPWFVHASKVG